MARRRFEYALNLKHSGLPVVPDSSAKISWRNPSVEDKQALAQLMFASYKGTIDYDGETLSDALKEIESFLSGVPNQDWLGYSWLAFSESELTAACLIGFWPERDAPLIAFIMTAPRWKGKHLATAALLRSLQKLAANQYAEVRAVITEDNEPSERLFTRTGFRRLSSD